MKIIIREKPQLYAKSPLEKFLEIPPRDPMAIALSRKQLENRQFPRKTLSNILVDYNQAIGNDSLAIENAKKIATEGSVCVITGQQLGLFGGSSYTILKAISALLLAKETNAIPIFWLATEDHDVDEINHTFLLDPMGDLKRFRLSLPKDHRFVEELELSDRDFDVIATFQEKAKISAIPDERSYVLYMIKQLLPLFAGTGIVFVEPKLLRPLATSFFQKEIAECDAITQILRTTTDEIVKAGGKEGIEIAEGTNLFMKQNGLYRRKIHRKGKGFQIAAKDYSMQELAKMIADHPEHFSTNAAARPVLQSLIFPTLAYVGGPSEINYHYQLGNYFRFHGIPMHLIVPRISATMITPQAEKLLRESGLNPWDELPLKSFHYVRNLIYPHEKLQERILNWWSFQSASSENLVQALLKNANWNTDGHLFCFLD